MTQRPEVAPNFSSRIVDLRARVVGVGAGLVDNNNQVRPEWATPASVGRQIDILIRQTDNSLHGVMVPPDKAELLELDMRALIRSKNTVSAIQVFGPLADVTQMDRIYVAHTVASMIVDPTQEEEIAKTITHVAAALGHRRSKQILMSQPRVSLEK